MKETEDMSSPVSRVHTLMHAPVKSCSLYSGYCCSTFLMVFTQCCRLVTNKEKLSYLFFVYMCAYMYLCFYVGDQRTTSADIPKVLSTFFIDRVSMPWNLPSSLGLMEAAPKMYLSVSLQGCDYKQMPPPSLALMRVLSF